MSLMRSTQTLFLVLKAGNLGAATAWSFALIFVLIRTMPIEDYSSVVIVTALGAYVMACDLGMSSAVYSRMRANLLQPTPATRDASLFAAAVLSMYLILVLIVSTAFAVACFALPIGTGQYAGALSLYFLSLSLALPWGIVRVLLGASDQYLRFESVEFARRLSSLVLVAALFAGMSFVMYAWLALASWLVAFLVLLNPVVRLTRWSELRSLAGWRSAFAGNRKLMGTSGQFSLLEFLVFNFPYLLIPLSFAGAQVLVAFDVFNKITRFGAQSNIVAFESMLPSTTRALYSGQPSRWVRGVGSALAISLICACAGSVFVLPLGDWTFGLLLGDARLVPQWLRICMAAMLFADVFRAAGALLLLNVGNAGRLLPYCFAGVAALAVLVAVTVGRSADFQSFMSGYVAIFAATSVLYFIRMAQHFHRVAHPRSA